MTNYTEDPWFRHRVLYQIYPRSFRDSNGDGVGDLRGIIEKLDYLAGKEDSLGIGAIWISPFYPSPMADFGYDVTNYCDVDPLFGTLEDFKDLLQEAHTRDLKVIIDFVPNHTSDEHPWFMEARSSRDNPKRNWYIWKDAKSDGSEPNNWQSTFGGPAWTFDDTTGQYYLHSFLSKQPDLNWDNTEVREAMKNQMKFWLDMGVDGFRVDAVSPLSKNPDFLDNPPKEDFKPGVDDPHKAWDRINSQNGPHLYDYLRELADFVGSYDERFMITEAYPHSRDSAASYLQFYRQVNPHACAPFNFEGIAAPWKAEVFKDFIDKFEYAIEPEYIPIYCLGNHDRSRLATRFGRENAATAAMMLLTLPGMPTMYYGEELGMTDAEILAEQVRDPYEINVPGKGNGRDPERTPMQWDASETAGFTTAQPWLPINPNHASINVADESKDQHSLLNLYRTLLRLRTNSHALRQGTYVPVKTPEGVFGFKRVTGSQTILVLLNFTDSAVEIPESLQQTLDGNVELSTYLDKNDDLASLRPREGRIYNLN